MAETQAKSGASGTSIDPPELDALGKDGAGSEVAIDRAAVGRASVPMDSPAANNAQGTGSKIDKGSPGAVMHGTGSTETVARPPAGTASARTAPVVGRGAAPAAGMAPRSAPPSRPVSGPGPVVTGTASAMDGAPPVSGASRVAEAVRTARATVSSAASRGPRRARLFVKRVDPWSVMKFSFAVSFVLFFVLVVATSVLYLALDQMGVFTSVNKALAQLVGAKSNLKVTASAVIGSSGAFGLVMVVLVTALSTLGAFIYNVCADLVGGIEVTLSEKE
jgi:hypothetical protein